MVSAISKYEEIEEDEDLRKAQQKVLADLLGKKEKLKPDWSNRRLKPGQRAALYHLEKGTAFEVVERTIEFGDDEVDPITKQVRPYAKQKGLVVTLELDPDNKQWIEHLMKALSTTTLKKSEVELFMKHIKRLNYQGALRDHYEFYGLSKKELKEREEKYRQQGLGNMADRLKKVIDRIRE